ncbi:MAG: hypothetical protein HC861_04360 [Rhodospirillaceae bacterium]|nr:hypothetical protein [Rhodospirillaceae bacterium]
MMIVAMGCASADPPRNEPTSRSRILSEVLNWYGDDGYSFFCLVGYKVHRGFKYEPVSLPPSFDRFTDGSFGLIRFDEPGCPTPTNRKGACAPVCGHLVMLDYSEWEYPALSDTWPHCEKERINFTKSRRAPPGKVVLVLYLQRDINSFSLTVIEITRCDYLVHESVIME